MRKYGNLNYASQPRRPSAYRQAQFRYQSQTKLPGVRGNTRRQWFVFGVVTLALAVGLYFLLKPAPDNLPGMVNAVQTEPEIVEPKIPPPKIDQAKLASEINSIIVANPQLDISVSYRDITTNTPLHYGLNDGFTAASIAKLVTAVAYLKDVDSEARSLSSSVAGRAGQDQLRLLIEQSDNAAWDALDGLLGLSRLNAAVSEIGMKAYNHSERLMTTDDAALLLQRLYQGELLKPESTDRLLAHLEAANYRQYIVAAVPEGVTVYHKVGYLKDRAHDVAIIDNGRHPYVLAIFTKARDGGYDFVTGPQVLQSLTKAIHKTYQQP